MSAATKPRTGQTVELARYATDMREQRVLVARRIEGVVRVYDVPEDGRGRSYHVDSGFASRAELAMLRRDYLREAERLGDCPMSPRGLRRLVETERRREALS